MSAKYVYAIYAQEDYERIDHILFEITKRGIPVKDGRNMTDNIMMQTLSGCEVVLLILSKNTLNSDYANRQLELVESMDKHVAPYYLDDINSIQMPNRLLARIDGSAAIPAYELVEDYRIAARAEEELKPYVIEKAAETNAVQPKKKGGFGKVFLVIALAVIIIIILSRLSSIQKALDLLDKKPVQKTVIYRDSEGNEIKTTTKAVTEMLEKVRKATIMIYALDRDGELLSTGSGFILEDEDAKSGEHYIITNYHVIEEGIYFGYTVADSEEVYEFDIVGTDEKQDVAILKTSEAAPEALVLSEEDISIGDEVYAAGFPQGIDFTVTKGNISNTHHEYETDDIYFLVTTPASPGNSGGPVVNMRGEVVGILTAKYTDAENMNMVRPADVIERVLRKSK